MTGSDESPFGLSDVGAHTAQSHIDEFHPAVLSVRAAPLVDYNDSAMLQSVGWSVALLYVYGVGV